MGTAQFFLLKPSGKSQKIFSKVRNEKLTLLVHFPEVYEKSQDKYPVLYLSDAYGLSPSSGPSSIEVAASVKTKFLYYTG